MELLTSFLLKGLVLKTIARALAAALVVALVRFMPVWALILGLGVLIWWCLT